MRNKPVKYLLYSLLLSLVIIASDEVDVGGPHSSEPENPIIFNIKASN